MVEAECAKAQIKTQVVLEMTSHEGILQAIAEGAEHMILPELYVRSRLAGSGLRIIDLYDPVPRHSVGFAYRGNRYQNIAARGFGTLCRTTMTHLLAHPKHGHRITVTTG
jgi:DNA-binding transcriptional LysR family regulator